jgi:hypothetical protein
LLLGRSSRFRRVQCIDAEGNGKRKHQTQKEPVLSLIFVSAAAPRLLATEQGGQNVEGSKRAEGVALQAVETRVQYSIARLAGT